MNCEELKINFLGFFEFIIIIFICACVLAKWLFAAYGLYSLLKG